MKMNKNEILGVALMVFVSVLSSCGSNTETDGGDFDVVVSDYPCDTDDDCAFTNLINIPASSDECQCHSPLCPPSNVVNNDEKNAREDAYNEFCGGITNSPPELACPVAACMRVCYELTCRDKLCIATEYECSEI